MELNRNLEKKKETHTQLKQVYCQINRVFRKIINKTYDLYVNFTILQVE